MELRSDLKVNQHGRKGIKNMLLYDSLH